MIPHVVLLLSGPLLVLLGVPLWLRRVPPNPFYGVRTRATLGDDAVWYEVNARGGRDLAIAATLYTIASRVVESVGSGWAPELRVLASAGLLIVALGWVTMRCARWSRTVR